MWVRSLGWADLLEEEMAIHSNILAWKFPQRSPACTHTPACRMVRGVSHSHGLGYVLRANVEVSFQAPVQASPSWLNPSPASQPQETSFIRHPSPFIPVDVCPGGSPCLFLVRSQRPVIMHQQCRGNSKEASVGCVLSW